MKTDFAEQLQCIDFDINDPNANFSQAEISRFTIRKLRLIGEIQDLIGKVDKLQEDICDQYEANN